jgi:hypothetical protein
MVMVAETQTLDEFSGCESEEAEGNSPDRSIEEGNARPLDFLCDPTPDLRS